MEALDIAKEIKQQNEISLSIETPEDETNQLLPAEIEEINIPKSEIKLKSEEEIIEQEAPMGIPINTITETQTINDIPEGSTIPSIKTETSSIIESQMDKESSSMQESIQSSKLKFKTIDDGVQTSQIKFNSIDDETQTENELQVSLVDDGTQTGDIEKPHNDKNEEKFDKVKAQFFESHDLSNEKEKKKTVELSRKDFFSKKHEYVISPSKNDIEKQLNSRYNFGGMFDSSLKQKHDEEREIHEIAEGRKLHFETGLKKMEGSGFKKKLG